MVGEGDKQDAGAKAQAVVPPAAATQDATDHPPHGCLRWIVAEAIKLAPLLSVLVAAGVAWTGVRSAAQTAESNEHTASLTEQGQLNERFTRGVEELGNRDESIQTGGVFALAQVAATNGGAADDARALVTLFVRVHLCDRSNPPEGSGIPPSGPPLSVSTGMQVLHGQLSQPSRRIDLSGLNCEHPHTNPSGAVDLFGADVHQANLRNTHLSGVNLEHANLTDADLTGAVLDDTDFDGADLTDTILIATVGLKKDQLQKAHWRPGHPPHVDLNRRAWTTR